VGFKEKKYWKLVYLLFNLTHIGFLSKGGEISNGRVLGLFGNGF
jgi:hypothetical protein